MKRVGPSEATRLINSEDALVVDVRSDGEFRQGHIINALNVPEKELDSRLDKLEKYKQTPIITVCRTGQFSAKAGAALRRQGFELAGLGAAILGSIDIVFGEVDR